MMMVDCDTENGGMEINPDFVVDFGKEPNGPRGPRNALSGRRLLLRYLGLTSLPVLPGPSGPGTIYSEETCANTK